MLPIASRNCSARARSSFESASPAASRSTSVTIPSSSSGSATTGASGSVSSAGPAGEAGRPETASAYLLSRIASTSGSRSSPAAPPGPHLVHQPREELLAEIELERLERRPDRVGEEGGDVREQRRALLLGELGEEGGELSSDRLRGLEREELVESIEHLGLDRGAPREHEHEQRVQLGVGVGLLEQPVEIELAERRAQGLGERGAVLLGRGVELLHRELAEEAEQRARRVGGTEQRRSGGRVEAALGRGERVAPRLERGGDSRAVEQRGDPGGPRRRPPVEQGREHLRERVGQLERRERVGGVAPRLERRVFEEPGELRERGGGARPGERERGPAAHHRIGIRRERLPEPVGVDAAPEQPEPVGAPHPHLGGVVVERMEQVRGGLRVRALGELAGRLLAHLEVRRESAPRRGS